MTLPCPECGGDSKVADTSYSAEAVTRWRMCCECKHRWKTIEVGASLFRRAIASSITAKEQKKLDNLKAKAERAALITKVVSLRKKIPPRTIAYRLGVKPHIIRTILRRAAIEGEVEGSKWARYFRQTTRELVE